MILTMGTDSFRPKEGEESFLYAVRLAYSLFDCDNSCHQRKRLGFLHGYSEKKNQ